MIVLESREFLNSQSLDENVTALVINPDELLGVPRTSMLSKAQRSVVIGEFFLLFFLPLKKPSHHSFFADGVATSTWMTFHFYRDHTLDPAVNDRRTSWDAENSSTLEGSMKTCR